MIYGDFHLLVAVVASDNLSNTLTNAVAVVLVHRVAPGRRVEIYGQHNEAWHFGFGPMGHTRDWALVYLGR